MDVLCVTETKHPYSSTECLNTGLYVEEERVRGDWRWYFSSGINPKDLEDADKIKKEGRKLPAELMRRTREHHGVAVMVHRR